MQSSPWALLMLDAALFHEHCHAVAGYLPGQQGENLYLVQRLLRARWLGLLGRAQRLKKSPARACRLEALEKVLRWREINAPPLDQLRAGLFSESVPHQALHLVPRERFLLRPGRQGEDQPIASMRRVRVFRNPIPPSQGCRGLRRVYRDTLPRMGTVLN